jgi:hypothetical protein
MRSASGMASTRPTVMAAQKAAVQFAAAASSAPCAMRLVATQPAGPYRARNTPMATNSSRLPSVAALLSDGATGRSTGFPMPSLLNVGHGYPKGVFGALGRG